MRWILGIGAAVMLVASARDAHACSPWDPSLDRTFPADGGVIPQGAVLLLDGQVLRPENLAVTVDGQPGQLVFVPERSHGFHYVAWDFAYRTMALRIEPPPQPGQAIVVTGDPCFQWKGMTYCDEVELTYTVGDADTEPPDAPAELWYDVYDHGSVESSHSTCGGPSARFEITVGAALARDVLEYPLEYRLSRRPRESPGAWVTTDHDWLRDAEANDPFVRWLYLPGAIEHLLPLAEAFCMRLQTFDASENQGGELEVCPPCRDQIGDGAGFISSWPDGQPSYDDEWLYPDGHCPTAREPDDGTETGAMGTTGGDESTTSLVTGELDPQTGSSSGSGHPGSDLPDHGCACSTNPTDSRWGSSGMLLGLLLAVTRRRDRRVHPRRRWLRRGALVLLIGVIVLLAIAPRYTWRRLPSLASESRAEVSALLGSEEEHDRRFSWTHAPILRATHPSGGALYYFGACHTADVDHLIIGKFSADWSEFGPTIGLVEQYMGFYVGGQRAAVARFGESAAVYGLGRRDGVPMYTLHREQTEHATELADEVGHREAATYLALRMAHGENPRGPISDAELQHSLEKRAVGVLAGAFASVADFDAFWNATFADESGDWRTLRWATLGPRLGHTRLEAVGHWDTVLRDVHMVRILVDQVARGERVFAVVGRSHVIQQEPAIRTLLADAELSVESFEHVPCDAG